LLKLVRDAVPGCNTQYGGGPMTSPIKSPAYEFLAGTLHR
jgi:hypothetical protein